MQWYAAYLKHKESPLKWYHFLILDRTPPQRTSYDPSEDWALDTHLNEQAGIY